MIPTLFHIGPIPVYSFGLMMFLAFLAASRLLSRELARAGEDPEIAEPMIFWAAVGGLIGARINYLISFPEEFERSGIGAVFQSAGFVFYGGFIGGIFAVYILLRKYRLDFWRFADLAGPALAIGYAVGRLGCQLSGDGDYGAVSSLPWAMSYSLGVVPTPEGVTVHPAPVYETLAAIGIVAVLLSPGIRARIPYRGQLFGLYLLLTGIERFAVEFVRIEPVIRFGLTQAQIVAVVVMLAGLTLISLPLIRKEHTSALSGD